MLRNYIKSAYRNLIRNKDYAIINIAGLAIGIAVCMVIFIIIQFHAGFDNFHPNKERIYRVITEYHHQDSKDVFYGKGVPSGFLPLIQPSFDEVEKAAPVLADRDNQVLILDGNNEPVKKLKEATGIFYTTPEFFSIFNYPLLSGSPATLGNPNTALLTVETAEKYFDDWKQATGRKIKLNNTEVVTVTGILAPIPANTGLPVKMIVSFGTGFTKRFIASTDFDGTSGNLGCYVLLRRHANEAAFNNKLKAYSHKLKSAGNNDLEVIQSLSQVHYDTKTGDFSGKTISRTLISVLWTIALFILLIACVNFINLSTAQAVNRAKEVGVRKVLGSNRFQLQLQFLTETFLIVLAAVMLSLAISILLLPLINSILGLTLVIGSTNALNVFLFLAGCCIVVTLIAGLYPAIVLAGFKPVTALKAKITAKRTSGVSLRRGLVVFQFIVTQSLIIGTLVIVKQMNYFASQPLGFDKDAIVNVPLPNDSVSIAKFGYLKQQLQGIPGLQHVTMGSNTPIEDNTDNWSMFTFDHAAKNCGFYSIFKTADEDYLATYQLPLIAGRNLAPSDTMREFLVNEMVVNKLGLKRPEDILHREIKFTETRKGLVVGVLADFNTRSFRDDKAPMLITSMKGNYNQAAIKLTTSNAASVLPAVEKAWNSNFPNFVFEYRFLDDKIETFYKQERQLSYLYKIFAVIAIFLSCLGLYGLASFMAVQRIKEVGIRKVLGASVQSIIYLFSREFILLISLSFVIATPLAWYYMNQWLQHFAYKIELSWWIFLLGGLAALIIALATVSFQAIKAAVANPVKSLRTE